MSLYYFYDDANNNNNPNNESSSNDIDIIDYLNILKGDFTNLPSKPPSDIRVFISSTFKGMSSLLPTYLC